MCHNPDILVKPRKKANGKVSCMGLSKKNKVTKGRRKTNKIKQKNPNKKTQKQNKQTKSKSNQTKKHG